MNGTKQEVACTQPGATFDKSVLSLSPQDRTASPTKKLSLPDHVAMTQRSVGSAPNSPIAAKRHLATDGDGNAEIADRLEDVTRHFK